MRAAEKRLTNIRRFSLYESITDFVSFIELTQKDLTDTFVKRTFDRSGESGPPCGVPSLRGSGRSIWDIPNGAEAMPFMTT